MSRCYGLCNFSLDVRLLAPSVKSFLINQQNGAVCFSLKSRFVLTSPLEVVCERGRQVVCEKM